MTLEEIVHIAIPGKGSDEIKARQRAHGVEVWIVLQRDALAALFVSHFSLDAQDICNLLRLASVDVEIILLREPKIGNHVRLDALGVREDIPGLLLKDARDAIEEVALQTQRKGRFGARDGFTGLGKIDLVNGFLCDLALALFSGGGNHPDSGLETALFVMAVLRTKGAHTR